MHIVECLRNPSEHVPAAAGTVNEGKSRSNSTLRAASASQSQPTSEHESFAKVFAIFHQRAKPTLIDLQRPSGSLHGNESCKSQRCLPTLAPLLLMRATRCLLNCNRRVPETKPAHFPRKQRMPRSASTSSVPRFCVQRTTQRRTLSRRPQRMTCMTLHLHPSPPPRLRAKHKSPCARDRQAHTTTYFAPTFSHRIPHYRAGRGRKEGRTAEQLTTMSYQLRHSLRGCPEKRRMQTMSEASLVFPDGECT
jgi:hypothetical protein